MEDIIKGKICPYCGAKSEFVDSVEIYGKSYGMVYLCRPCKAWVGVHKGTEIALGRLADEELRIWKKKAHFYFDALWKLKIERNEETKENARSLAYKWLSQEMGISPQETHIGMFDIQQCMKVVELCAKYHKKY